MPTTLTELFDLAVARHPTEPAVSSASSSWSYRQLAGAAEDLARRLALFGIGPEDRVGIYLPRGIDAIAAVLGTLRAGAAYVPVDTSYPDARRDHMLRDAGVRIVVTAPGWLSRMAGSGAPVLEWELPVEHSDDCARATSRSEVSEGSAACVLYTSGSTGTPKGVVLQHRQMVSFALDAALPTLRPGDRMAQTSSISFDTFTFELWRTMAGAAQLVVLPSTAELIGGDVQRTLRRARITAMLAPATALNHVARFDREAFSSLRLLCSGGDVLLPQTCRELISGGFTGTFFNLYGPTEATVACSGHRIDEPPPSDATHVPIGAALAGDRLYVLDDALTQCSPGTTGELYIAGAGVARGYTGMPGVTALRFVADPFTCDGARMYRSGDRVLLRPDGELEYLGRFDSQVKIRGHRVNPADVEVPLRKFDAVRDAAVSVVGEQADRRIVAFVVPATERLSLRELRRDLAAVVPDFLIPAEFVVVKELPTDVHGKRNLTELAAMAEDTRARRAQYVAPRTDTERYLITVWEELLQTESLGIHDDFFALGGHSLLAVRLRSILRRDHGVELDPEALFSCSQLDEQAELVDRTRPVSTRP